MGCYRAEAKHRFQLLKAEKAAIEAEVGSPLDWEELPDRVETRISLTRSDLDPNDRDDWPNQHRWLAENLVAR